MFDDKERDVLYSLGFNEGWSPKEFELKDGSVSISCYKWYEGSYEFTYDNPAETGDDSSYSVPLTKFDDMIELYKELKDRKSW